MTAVWRMHWALLFLLFALPLLFFPFTYLAFELPKVFLLYLFTVFTFLFASSYKPSKLTKIHWLYLIFVGWIVLSAVLGLSFQRSFLGSYFRWQGIITWICYFWLFFISGKLFEDNHLKKQACLIILISSVVSALIAILQFILLWFLGGTSQLLYSGRVISTFGQPNFLATFLVMSLPFVWYYLKQTKTKLKILIGFAISVIVLGIFSTLSRSAYLGLIFLTLVWGIYHYRLLLLGIILSVILFAILANLFPNLVYSEWHRFKVDTIFTSLSKPPTYNSNWTAENRLIIAQKSLKLIAQKPFTGYGLENFALAFPSVVSINDLGLKDIVVDSSHNLFLDLAVQLGLIGLLLFLTVNFSTIYLGLKQLKTAEAKSRDFTKAAVCVVLVFLIIHQFSPISVVPMIIFWLSLGIINGPVLSHTNLSKNRKFIFNIFGISLLIITSLFIIQTIRADILFRESSAYEVSDIQRSIRLDNDSIKLAPWVQFYSVRRNFLLKQLGY